LSMAISYNEQLLKAFMSPEQWNAMQGLNWEQRLTPMAQQMGAMTNVWDPELGSNVSAIDSNRFAELKSAYQNDLMSKYVPQELMGTYTPVNYGVGTDVLRDAQGRTLGRYQVQNGDTQDNFYAPWDVLKNYQQLNPQLATQYQEASSNPLKDPMFLAMIGAGTGLGMFGAELGLGAGAGSASAGGTAAAGSLMPAAQAVAPSTLAEWGLLQTAPGVWSAPALGGAAAGGAMMPAAIPPGDPTFGGALTQTSPGVFSTAAPAAGGGVSLSTASSAASGAKTILDQAKELAPYAPLLGMAAGGLAGGLGGTGSPGTITVEEGIPDWLMPYVKPTLDAYSTQVQNYQTDPYGIMPSAMKEFQNTISGQYLDPSTNKWLEEYYKLGAERVKGTLSPSFGHMQAFGNHSGYNEALSRGLSDMAVGLYGGAYEKERARQNDMIAAAPNFLTQSSTSAFAPYQQYLSTIGSLGKKKDQPYWEPSAMQNILGGAMAGYGLGSIFK
jgi:hypothetical protein